MDASTSGADGGPSGDHGQAVRRRNGMTRWLQGAVRADSRAEVLVRELEDEVALLREENARLRTRRERAGGRPWGMQVGELVPARPSADGGGAEDASELLTECRILRTELLDACREVEAAMQQVRRRLERSQPPETTPAAVRGPRASAER